MASLGKAGSWTLIKHTQTHKAGREGGVCGTFRVCWGCSSWSWEWELLEWLESSWSWAVESWIVVLLVSNERAKKADDSCLSECASGVRRNSTIVLYYLLIGLLSFSLLPIHFYFDKRVDFRSLTTKQDSFPIGGTRTWHKENIISSRNIFFSCFFARF